MANRLKNAIHKYNGFLIIPLLIKKYTRHKWVWLRLITLSNFFFLHEHHHQWNSCRRILTLDKLFDKYFFYPKGLSVTTFISYRWYKHQRFSSCDLVHTDRYVCKRMCISLCLVYLFLLNLTGKTTPTDWSNPITPTLLTFSMR